MPKRSKQIFPDPAPAEIESFEPYWNKILIIVMVTFSLYGLQALTFAVQERGLERVASCFTETNQSAYHKFKFCTAHS